MLQFLSITEIIDVVFVTRKVIWIDIRAIFIDQQTIAIAGHGIIQRQYVLTALKRLQADR